MVPSKEEWIAALEERHGKEMQERFSGSVVAVCGLGGLGSNVCIHLARAGVGKLILIDFDKVDITNLHRQQYKVSQIGMYKTKAMAVNLKEINPYIDLKTHTGRLTGENIPELLAEAHVICEAFDNPEAKAMLTETVLGTMKGKFLVAASGMAGMGSANEIHTRKINDRFYLCGDEVSDVNDGMGLVASRVALCAAHEAHTILRILAGKEESI